MTRALFTFSHTRVITHCEPTLGLPSSLDRDIVLDLEAIDCAGRANFTMLEARVRDSGLGDQR